METRNITNEEVMELTVQEHGDFAKTCEVTNEIQLHNAGEFLVDLKRLIKEVEAWFAPMIDDAYRAHKTICAKKNVYVDPLKAAEAEIKRKIGNFQMELDRKREVEERKAREEADRLAEKERNRLMAQATKQEAKGNGEQAAELLQAAADVYVAPAPVAAGIQGPKGVGVRYEFVPEVTNKAQVPDDFKVVDLGALKRVGNATKDNPPTIAGIRWIKRPVVSGRVAK
jgi:hypothetical protein